MEQGTPGNARPWRVVAAEVTTEQDSKKLAKLVEELKTSAGRASCGEARWLR